eukprot:gene8660-13074_t
MLIFNCLGYLMVTEAYRHGTASTVTPYRYSRILFAVLIGIVVFSESPGINVLVGTCGTIASGLYVLRIQKQLEEHEQQERERREAQEQQ